jgi:serine protease AprX
MPRRVLVELRGPAADLRGADSAYASDVLHDLPFELDGGYTPQPVPAPENADVVRAMGLRRDEQLVVVRGEVPDGVSETDLLTHGPVAAIWTDARVQAFERPSLQPGDLALVGATAACPCPENGCDCDPGPGGAHGTDDEVAAYLGADQVWAEGIRGSGIVVGVVDTGVRGGSFPGKVIDGWSPSGGSPPGDDGAHYHGSMCANAVLTVAPDAAIYDIGLLKSSADIDGFLSDAIAGYNWALARYETDGTPQILTNSWGMYQENWAPDYCTNPNHPFTRKVVETINRGILVTFAAGNCGQQCPSGRCGSDVGPGRSIWGANGHPLVMTVGAANIDEQWIGYTSQGPAALAPDKPNFCAPSHFTGYTQNDNGTSAACPVAAGVLALLREARPTLQQANAKLLLQQTAKDLCAAGWDANSGHGMISAQRAYRSMTRAPHEHPICGIQWHGQIPPHATQRWFTFNWPAVWHVTWSVMPTSPRPGGPQLSWDVEVERADGDHVTYWITVQNVTDQDVDFEGRYCILASD